MSGAMNHRMRRIRRSDSGNAVIEFAMLAVVAIVPLAWAALALQQMVAVHAAAQSAAGESLRAFISAPSEPLARQRADAAARLAVGDHRAITALDTRVDCDAGCLAPGTGVRVVLTVHAELPQIPVLGITPAMTAQAEQFGVVDAYAVAR